MAVLKDAEASSDSVAQARALTWLGLVAWRTGDYGEARRLGEKALESKRRLGLAGDYFRSYNALGLLAWNEGRLGDALDLFEEASASASAVGDDKGVASAAGNLALVHTDLGEFTKARRGFLAARDAGRDLEDARIEGNALTNLGMLEVAVGDPAAALRWLQEARRRYHEASYPTGEQNALGQLGTAYAALGEPSRAFAALDSALALARRQKLRQEEASNLEALADLHRDAGDFQGALALFREARAINDELGLTVETGSDLRSEAEILAVLGDVPGAVRRAEAALRTHRTAGVRWEELSDLLLLTELLAGRDRPQAERRLEEARRLATALATPLARSHTALAEAKLADIRDEPALVLRALSTADGDLSGGYGLDWQVQSLRARAHARLGNVDSAATAARLAVDAIERVRGNFRSGALRTSYGAGKARAYADLVGILLRLGRVDEAFEYADAARGGALREQLLAAAEGAEGGAARSLRQGERLLREIGELTTTLSELEQASAEPEGTASAPGMALVRGRLREAREEYEALLVRTSELSGAEAALLGGARIRAADVREALAPDEAVLEFLAMPDRLVLFVARSDGIRTYETALSEDNLASRIRLATGVLQGREAAPAAGASDVLEGLYDALVGPAVRAGELRGVRRLVVVPHGALSYLPFAALRDALTGRRVVEEFSVLTLPTSAVLPALRSIPQAPPEVGNEGLEVLAPFPERLPATRREANALREVARDVRLRIGGQATESALREALSTGRIVHVASHGLLNARSPMFSRIELASGSGNDPADDGRLEVHELLGLSVDAQLVFLSGCETALGRAWSTEFARGEEYATLAQAFLHAGARNVVATLWRVEDEGAAYMAERFHRHLREVAPAEALARAQRDALAHPRFSSPYHWAAYVVSGDGGPLSR